MALFYAQKDKGRTGALWAVLTFVVGVGWWMFCHFYAAVVGAENFYYEWAELQRAEERAFGMPLITAVAQSVWYGVMPTGGDGYSGLDAA